MFVDNLAEIAAETPDFQVVQRVAAAVVLTPLVLVQNVIDDSLGIRVAPSR